MNKQARTEEKKNFEAIYYKARGKSHSMQHNSAPSKEHIPTARDQKCWVAKKSVYTLHVFIPHVHVTSK